MAAPRIRPDVIVIASHDHLTIVEDLQSGVAHELEGLTAWVLEHADGTRSPDDLATEAQAAFADQAISAESIFGACDVLADLELLEDRIAPPTGGAVLTRRTVLRRLGLGAAVAAALRQCDNQSSEESAKADQEQDRKQQEQQQKVDAEQQQKVDAEQRQKVEAKAQEQREKAQQQEQQQKQDAEQQQKDDARQQEQQQKVQQQEQDQKQNAEEDEKRAAEEAAKSAS